MQVGSTYRLYKVAGRPGMRIHDVLTQQPDSQTKCVESNSCTSHTTCMCSLILHRRVT